MKSPFVLRSAVCVFALLLSLSWVYAAPPDLTAAGVIPTIDRSSTYNLGATGLRGWIYVDRNNVGDIGLMTDQSRQILVTTASAPGNAVLQVDDVILGAIAASSGVVPNFTTDCRKAFGAAITNAEKTGAGTLRVKRWRAGVTTDVNIPITILGNYSGTAPYSCPKSSAILASARNQLVGELLGNPDYLRSDYDGAINALALLASVEPVAPNYAAVQTRLQAYARARAYEGPVNKGLPIWDWSYTLLFLSEYYLSTGDSQVISGINQFTLKLAQSQSVYGTFGHDQAYPRPDGSGRRVSIGYGPVNSAGVVANLAMVLGKKALSAANQPIDAEINAAIDRGTNFFAFYVNKGSIPYGEHEAVAQNHASNGKDPAAAVFFALQGNRVAETEYFSRMSISTWIGREYGHTGQGLGYLWTALGAAMGGELAAAEHLKKVLWHLDLSRRTDGSFAYDGQEQYGGGTTADGTYLGRCDYYGMNLTAAHLLTYSLPLKRLYITGKSANPAHTLDATKVANAVSAATIHVDRASMSVSQLFAALGDYDPVVRHYASVELAARTLSGTDLGNLRDLLASTDANIRRSACQVIGLIQDTASLPTLVSLLSDPDAWVRAKAATAIRGFNPAAASVHRDAMMNTFIANARDPDAIDWSDPIQMSNGKLSLAIFGNGVPDGSPGNDIASYTIDAPKETLLYPALRVGLRQPDSYPRLGVSMFARQRLALADFQALYPDFVKVAANDTPADRMWSADNRAEAIRMMGNFKIAEGIPLALSMLEVPDNFGWGSSVYVVSALEALASYGDAAHYTLPTLRSYLGKWNAASSEYAALVNTINTLENAITAPPLNPGVCVANSQVVTTTGPKVITLTGASPRGAFTFIEITPPAYGTISGTAPNLTYTPNAGYTGPDKFTFKTTDGLTTSAPATVAIVVGASGNGFQGQYYDNADFTNLKLTRIDPQINFDWGTGSPDPSIGADTFSVRWSGVLLVPQTGNYTFSALTSDGIRIYVNGTPVIDSLANQDTRWTDGNPIALTAGQLADIRVEYYENTGSAAAKLKWTGPSFVGSNGDIIPQAYLFDGSGIANRPAYAFPQNLTTARNTALPITLDGTGGTLTYQVLSQPANGTLSGTAPNLTYTPNTNFSGSDSFTFRVNNGTTNSQPATVTIGVQFGALTSFNWAAANSGNWSDATKWTPGVPASAGQVNYALNFAAAGTYTVTHNLTNGFLLNQLNTGAGVTIAGTPSMSFAANGGSLPQFNQSGAQMVTVNTPVNLASTTNFAGIGAGEVVLTNQITGTGGLLKTSSGRLRIHGFNSNNYSGGTTINSGTLVLGAIVDGSSPESINPLGTGSVTLNGATIECERVSVSRPLVVNGGTLVSSNGWGATWSGAVTLNQSLTARSDYTLTFSGSISGSGGMIKLGGSDLNLTVANTYTGTTDVREGTLACSVASALGAGPLIIAAPGKVALNFTGTRTVQSLTLGGQTMPAGTYGASNQSAYFFGTGTVTVNPQTTTTTALARTSGSNPAAFGSYLTFTATVTGSSPTGTVQFLSGTTVLGTGTLNGSFQATFTTNQLAPGTYSITARYLGNTTNASSTSSPLSTQVNAMSNQAPAITSAATTDTTEFQTVGATTWHVVRGTGTNLSVAASDDSGEAALLYTWQSTGPAPVTFSTNGNNQAKSAAATFTASGDYTLTVTVTDNGGLSATSTVRVRVLSTLTLSLSPASVTLLPSQTQQFTATLTDQFGNSQPTGTINWATTGGGTVSGSGLFSATTAGGPYQVTATAGTYNASASVTVNRIQADIALQNLIRTFSGSPQTVTAVTTPAGLSYSVTYNGQSTAPTAAGSYAVVATITDPNYQGTANGTLVITHVISYRANGATGGSVPPDQSKFVDVDVTLATNSGFLAKSGSTFTGWNTAADGSGTAYAAGAIYTGNASLTLYAQWSAGGDGTWIQTTAGPFNWGTSGNWNGGSIASGADRTASFTPNITATQTVTLDAARTIGNITFTDSATSSHDLTISGANVLTLSRTSGAPIIDVTQSGRTLTIGSVISGNTGLQKNGPGTLILNATSPGFSGDLTVAGGTLRFGDSTGPAVRLGAAIYTGTITNNGTLWFSNNDSQEISGVISGTGVLNKGGGGTLTLSGANTYTGKTIISATGTSGTPTLSISSFNSVNGGTPARASSSLGAPTTVANGYVQLGNSGIQRACNLIYTGPGETTDRVMDIQFNGSSKHIITANTTGGGMLKFTSNFAITPSNGTTSGGLTLSGSGDGEIAQIGTIPGFLDKSGNGTWTLNGTNQANSGTVTAGTLIVNGTLTTTTTLSVAANATLGGTGTVGGNTTIAANGRLTFNLTTPAASHDSLDLAAGKSLTLSGASVLTITTNGNAQPGIYTLLTAPGGITGAAPATLNLPPGWAATVSISGNSLVLNVTSTGQSGPVDHYDISPISSPQAVGVPITGVTITAKNIYNNTVVGFTGTVTFGGTGGFTGTSASFVAGVLANASVTPTVIGSNRTLTATDTSGNTGSATIQTINPGPVAAFVLSPITLPQTVGTPISGITITAKDAYNNTATGFTGTVSFGGTGGFSGNSGAFTAGVLAGASVTPTVIGTNLTLTVSDGANHTGSTVISSVRSIFQTWASGPFTAPLTNTTPTLDFDGGGQSTGIEWVTGGDPTKASDDIAFAPVLDTNSDPAYYIYTYRRSDVAFADPNTAISVEYSRNLQSWTTAVHDGTNVIISVSNDGAGSGIDLVTVRLKRTLASGGGKFYVRLRVVVAQ